MTKGLSSRICRQEELSRMSSGGSPGHLSVIHGTKKPSNSKGKHEQILIFEEGFKKPTHTGSILWI